jgi:hypothetical protein
LKEDNRGKNKGFTAAARLRFGVCIAKLMLLCAFAVFMATVRSTSFSLMLISTSFDFCAFWDCIAKLMLLCAFAVFMETVRSTSFGSMLISTSVDFCAFCEMLLLTLLT